MRTILVLLATVVGWTAACGGLVLEMPLADDPAATDVVGDSDLAPPDEARGAVEHTFSGASAAGDIAPSQRFNQRGRHNDQCVRLKRSPVPLRFADFSATGYVLVPSALRFGYDPPLRDDDDDHACRDGEVQLDAQEILATPQGRLLFHRGGYKYVNGSDIKSGHLWIGDLAEHAAVERSTDLANGAPCIASRRRGTEGHYRIKVVSLPAQMRFRKSNYAQCVTKRSPKQCSNGFQSYGDPGYDQGHFAQRHHYSYLLWSWVNVPGGGAVRALLEPGQVFHRCNVRSIKHQAIDETGARVGWVQAIYGKTRAGENWLYGWTVYRHYLAGDAAPTLHVERL